MARPRSEDKRNAIVAAAIRVIVKQGLGAPTAAIARKAGVANGSLFTYFETKAELLNHLYLELKNKMASAALEGLTPDASDRDQLFHLWSGWMRWAAANPEERRAAALLGVCEDITPATRAAGHQTMAGIAALLERCRAQGPLRKASMGFVVALLNSLADATMDFTVQDPSNAKKHSEAGFDALWRVLT
jgi:AcrR family transcriptional regulator